MLKMKGVNLFVAEGAFSLDNAEYFEARLEQQADLLSRHVENVLKRAEGIRADVDLSEEGKRKRLSDLYGQHADFLEALQEDQEGINLAKRKDEARQALALTLDPERQAMDSARAELRAQEIRQHFKSLDPVFREDFYWQAIKRGDVETARALEDAPAFYDFLAPAVISEGQRYRQAAADPENAGFVQDVKTLESIQGYNLARAETALEDLKKVAQTVNPERFDPLVMQARGTGILSA